MRGEIQQGEMLGPLVRRILLLACATACQGVSVGAAPLRPPLAAIRRSPAVTAVVLDVSSTEEFEKALESAGDSLVVVDYSTSWCGPCNTIAPNLNVALT